MESSLGLLTASVYSLTHSLICQHNDLLCHLKLVPGFRACFLMLGNGLILIGLEKFIFWEFKNQTSKYSNSLLVDSKQKETNIYISLLNFILI